MPNDYYLELWKESQKDLKNNLVLDRWATKKGLIKDRNYAKWLIGHLFMGYVRIVNKLDDCYDQIIHPQKREVIGRVLDCCLGRLLELKRDIVRIELDDYVFFDNILMELKLTPQDVEITVPKYFWRDRQKSMEERRVLIKRVYEQNKEEEFKNDYLKDYPEDEREEAWENYLKRKEMERLEHEKMEELQKKRMAAVEHTDAKKLIEGPAPEKTPQNVIDAVLLIQRHERARQSRRLLPAAKRRRKLRNLGVKEEKIPLDKASNAAVKIQRAWRNHRKRVMEEKLLEQKMLQVGMLESSWKDKSRAERIEKIRRERITLQERNQEEYEKALVTVKEKMAKFFSMYMEEDITDEIRYWFEWFYQQVELLPDYPDDKPIVPTGEILGVPKKIPKEFIDKTFPPPKTLFKPPKNKLHMKLTGTEPIAGSALIVAGYWIQPKQFLICQNELERMKKSGKKGGGKKVSKEERAAQRKKEREAEKRRLAAEELEGFRLKDSGFMLPLAKADKDYTDYWLDLDESNNYEQRYIYDLVKNEKCWELSMEIRNVVDDAMRLELEALKDALDRDKKHKKKKRKKGKKRGKKGKKKGKKKKDPTEGKTTDELFTELFKNGIIREFDEAHLKDYMGDRSYSAYDYRRKLEDGPPETADVRDLILQLCILPLGSYRIHQLSPVIRSVCLIGPEHCGKEYLARIVCTETASVLFDLTPENTAGKYEGKDNMKMLLHLVEKVSRLVQPSVILVDGAEKLFYKKVPKEQKQYEPKRLGKTLSKLVKSIKQDDQVLVLGVSSFPWLCPKRKLVKTYDKFIYVPQPRYGTYFMVWKNLLTPYHSLPKDFDFSCLARVSNGYSLKTIMDIVQKVMNPKRIAESRVNPYKPSEFIDELCMIEPIAPKIVDKFTKFYNKTDLRKKRLAKLAEEKNLRDKPKK